MGGADDVQLSRVSAPCTTCGKRIRGDDRADMIEKYTDHQVTVHNKPRAVKSRKSRGQR